MINMAGADLTSTKAAGSGSVREAAVGPFDRVSPVLLNGNGFSTSLVFTNLDIKTIYLELYFVKSDGTDLVLLSRRPNFVQLIHRISTFS